MRITNGTATGAVGKGGSKSRTSSNNSSFQLPQNTEGASRSRGAVQNGSVHDVSSLLALQGVEDAMQGKKRKAVRRGNRMLDLLEDVRMGLLSGTLPMSIMQQLERLAQEQEQSGDERIDELLLEIGLRAKVEIAKFEASNQRK